MGKYNFSAQKFIELEQRLEALERVNDELRKENAELKKPAEKPKKRSFMQNIGNAEKAEELFGLTIHNEKLVRTDETEIIANNFQVFHHNLLRVIKPIAYHEPSMVKWRIRGAAVNSLTDEEFAVCAETIEAVVDTLYYAKKKLEGVHKDD